jgi:hypothetical protein
MKGHHGFDAGGAREQDKGILATNTGSEAE